MTTADNSCKPPMSCRLVVFEIKLIIKLINMIHIRLATGIIYFPIILHGQHIASGIDGDMHAMMPMNQVQFQPGLSLLGILKRYATQAQCEQALAADAGNRASPVSGAPTRVAAAARSCARRRT